MKQNAFFGRPSIMMISAFLCYTGMYAVRKSFLAGQFSNQDFYGFDYKSILVISQVIGYMLSKFIGVKIVSESKYENRHISIFGLVTFGLIMLSGFAWAPVKFKPIFLFLNGLPLGMVFGLVLSYLEGRQKTELLAVALSSTFIFSTGLVKSAGSYFISLGISEYTMPFLVGLMFFPLFLISLFFLKNAPAPNREDVSLRSERKAMKSKDRVNFIKRHTVIFCALVVCYITLTVLRDFRDNFIVEFWNELGHGGNPGLLAYSEIPVALGVLLITASLVLIKSNEKALKTGLVFCFAGAVITILSTLFFKISLITGITWVVVSGFGIYLPYILFHAVIYERLIAFTREKANVGFLFYTSDALGYAGSVGILLTKELGNFTVSWVDFFQNLNLFVPVNILILILIVWMKLNSPTYSKKRNEKTRTNNLSVLKAT